MAKRYLPEAIVAQMIRADIFLEKLCVRDGTNLWYEYREDRWVSVSLDHIRTKINQYCLNKYLTATDENDRQQWEYYCSIGAQKNLLQLVKLHESVRKDLEFFTPSTIDITWDKIVEPNQQIAITSGGLYKVYRGFCEDNLIQHLRIGDFVPRFKEHDMTRKHSIFHKQYNAKDPRLRLMPGETPNRQPMVWQGLMLKPEFESKLLTDYNNGKGYYYNLIS